MQTEEILVREPIQRLKEGDEQLACDAELLLGYSGLRKQLGCSGPLGQALRVIEIEPYNAGSVHAFKKRKRADLLATLPHGYGEYVDWKRVPFAEFNDAPIYIVYKAVSIIKAIPYAKVWIEELVVPKFSEGDPFLGVTCGDEEYYVDQWDEPEMNG